MPSSWPVAFSMIGPSGSTGGTGNTGLTGPQGVTGPTGLGFSFRGSYDKTISYKINDIVLNNNATQAETSMFPGTADNNTYICIGNNTPSGLAPNSLAASGEWSLFSQYVATGVTGDAGATGSTGAGVPPGGSTGQVLSKTTNANYDTSWVTITAGSGGNGSTGATGATGASLILGIPAATSNTNNTYIDTASGNLYLYSYTTGTTITTIAGTGDPWSLGDNGPAISTVLSNPQGLAFDISGNLYIADSDHSKIRKIDTSGIITTIAGTGEQGFSGDGYAATDAKLYNPNGVAIDISGNLYISDIYNNRIRKINAQTQVITTIAGTGVYGFSGDGLAATDAELRNRGTVAVDRSGNVYIADSANNRIRKINAQTQVITTIAGTGDYGYNGDGTATSAQLNYPSGITVDISGNLYIADRYNYRIRKIDTSGNIITIAGTGDYGFSGDGLAATDAHLDEPSVVAVDISGNVYFSDSASYRIRKINTSGIITTIAGTGVSGFSGDGFAATDAIISSSYGITVDAYGNVYISDSGNHRIRKINTSGTITTIAGTAAHVNIGDGAQATSAQLNYPFDVALDISGNLYIADTNNSRIRKIDAQTQVITTIAGTGVEGFSGDGFPAIDAKLANPYGVAVDISGNIYIADTSNNRIRKIDAQTQVITTTAGTGVEGFYGNDSEAVFAELYNPYGLDIDISGNIYFADSGNHRIRKIDTSGIITTIAGTGVYGFSGDGYSALLAELYNPRGVAVDAYGNVYIADISNYRIRKIDTSGNIITIAGTGVEGFSGDNGPATDAKLNEDIKGIAVDISGNVYIADTYNNRIRKINTSGIITTIAGTGVSGFSGDNGLATSANLNTPSGLAVDTFINLYIADRYNNRIRKITSSLSWNITGNITGPTGASGVSTAYTPAVPANWGSPVPTDIVSAIDRLAAAVAGIMPTGTLP